MPITIGIRKPKFELGEVVGTPGAAELLNRTIGTASGLLWSHQRGIWGDLSDADKAANDAALLDGSRILSSYIVNDETGEKVWIITDAAGDDGKRERTTVLTPDEY